MNAPSSYDFMYKILMLGDSQVGKTSFLLRYCDNNFIDNPITTVGLDYKLKYITLSNGKIIKLQIWDTAGQDKFRAITQNYYKGAQGIILMYDITSAHSFKSIKGWLNSIKNNSDENIKILLIGNKFDCVNHRTVSSEEGQALAKDDKLGFFETSAKEKINLDESIQFICNEIYKSNDAKTDKNTKNKKKFFLFSKKAKNGDISKRKCCK